MKKVYKKNQLLEANNIRIEVNEAREVDSIKLKINDRLVDYISNKEGVSINGTPSSFMLRNVGIKTLNLNIAI